MDFTSFQEGARRLDAAMAGVPDRVPVYAQIHEFAMRWAGIPAREFYSRPDLLVPAELEVQRAFGLDVATISFDVYSIEVEALGQPLVFSDEFVPDVDRSAPMLASREDVGRIRTPDFEAAGRCRNVLEMHALYSSLTGLEPTLNFTAPFTLAASLRGIEQLIYDIHSDPRFARSLLDRLTGEVLAPWIEFQRRAFPRAGKVRGVDATASLPVVNLRILRDWAAPYILQLRDACGPEVDVANWVGESYLRRPEEMLELKLAVCPGSLQGQDPDVEKLGPETYRRFADEHDVPLVLGIGARFLAMATPGEIAERVRSYISSGGTGGRFALYLCNVGGTTPAENLVAAVAAARECGVY